MTNTIKLCEDVTLVRGSSYYDWVVKASKTQIMNALGIKPSYFGNKKDSKVNYSWKLLLNDSIPFIIYDMSYGHKVGKDMVIEYHIGWKEENDNIGDITLLISTLKGLGLNVDHSEMWYKYRNK